MFSSVFQKNSDLLCVRYTNAKCSRWRIMSLSNEVFESMRMAVPEKTSQIILPVVKRKLISLLCPLILSLISGMIVVYVVFVEFFERLDLVISHCDIRTIVIFYPVFSHLK